LENGKAISNKEEHMIIIQVNKLENAHMEVKTAFLPISIGQPYWTWHPQHSHFSIFSE
jgi:hypothetical protein